MVAIRKLVRYTYVRCGTGHWCSLHGKAFFRRFRGGCLVALVLLLLLLLLLMLSLLMEQSLQLTAMRP